MTEPAISKLASATHEQPVCSGCHQPLEVGEHYFELPQLIFRSWMGPDWEPEVNVPPTIIEDLIFHHAGCFIAWAVSDPRMVDVFGPEGARGHLDELTVHPVSPRMYRMSDRNGQLVWVTMDEARIINAQGGQHEHLVREPDGLERQISLSEAMTISGRR